MFLAELVREVLSKIQNERTSKRDDLPLALGANIPIIPWALSNLTKLSSPYENILENSKLVGVHKMFSAKSSELIFVFSSFEIIEANNVESNPALSHSPKGTSAISLLSIELIINSFKSPILPFLNCQLSASNMLQYLSSE